MIPALELKVPPPLVALTIAGGMWWLAGEPSPMPDAWRARQWLAVVFLLAGLGIAFAAVFEFRRARTTVNPLRPESSSALVTSGICAWTRNPMYLGMTMVLIAWSLWLGRAMTALGPIAFALYITRFQIMAEERALARRFGAEFDRYRGEVRRWL